MSESNRMAFRYLKETVWGTTPAAAMKTLRVTGESINDVTATTESQEIRSDRQLADIIRVGKSAAGDVNFELSYGTLDEFLEAALCSTWQTDQGLAGAEIGTDLLENGTTKSSFSLEKQFEDLTNVFLSTKGFRINTLNLNFALRSVITGSFGGMGKRLVPAAASIGTGAAVVAGTNPVISVIDVASMSEGGAAFTAATEFSIAIANNLRVQDALGSIDPYGIGYGGFRVTGTLTAYFESLALYQKYSDFTQSSVAISITDSAGNAYVFDLPAVKYSAGEVVAGGGDQDVLVRMPYTSIIDSVSGQMLRVTRTP